jgi:hypothetical protein
LLRTAARWRDVVIVEKRLPAAFEEAPAET